MARWTASAKWAVGPALDGQRGTPLALRLSEGLGRAGLVDGASSHYLAHRWYGRVVVVSVTVRPLLSRPVTDDLTNK